MISIRLMALLALSAGVMVAAGAFGQSGDPEKAARSIALFREAGKVLQHPRCLNCHPAGDRPTQTDRMTPHRPMVIRGDDGHGAPGLPCSACHHAANYEESGVPGMENWRLAPASMAWAGRSLGEICRQIKDEVRSGKFTQEKLLNHVSGDKLVGWAWKPGGNRTPAPGTQAKFGELMQAWFESDAVCPAE
ncbi:MAG TPA: Isoquinoline 1-oxidoreductase subunit [Reyranella sp.]